MEKQFSTTTLGAFPASRFPPPVPSFTPYWCDAWCQKHWPLTVYERRATWILPEYITLHSKDWKQSIRLGKSEFHITSHANPNDKYATGGHNWYMTTRFDIGFRLPGDPYWWHGYLITGGINTICKVRRTKIHEGFFRITTEATRKTTIEPATHDILRVTTPRKPTLYAKYWPTHGWRAAEDIGTLLASRMAM